MAEQFSNSENLDPRHHAERLMTNYERILQEAVRVGYPERVSENPLDVFPQPTTPRDQAPDPGWTPEQQDEMRQLVAEFGYGREGNRTVSELGLSGAHVIIEGGQPHKIKAEVQSVMNDIGAQPSSYVFAASAYRGITGEQASAEKQVGFVPKTEYDVARAIAEQTEGFAPNEGGDEALPLSYDTRNGFAIGQKTKGQFVRIGHINEKPVILFRVDRENYVNDQGAADYRNQPGTADTIKIISEAQKLQGDSDTPLAFVSSATYQASREAEAVRAGLATDRVVGVPTYGTAQLATVKGEPTPAPAPLNQIPGELYAAAQSVARLAQEIDQQK